MRLTKHCLRRICFKLSDSVDFILQCFLVDHVRQGISFLDELNNNLLCRKG